MNYYETESLNFEIFFNNSVTNRNNKRGHKSELKNLYLYENGIFFRGLPNYQKQLENIKERLSLAYNFMLDNRKYDKYREHLLLIFPKINGALNCKDISEIVDFGMEVQMRVLPQYQ